MRVIPDQDLRSPEGPVDRIIQILDEIGRSFFHGLCDSKGERGAC